MKRLLIALIMLYASASYGVTLTPEILTYSDTEFTPAESPVTLDFYTDLMALNNRNVYANTIVFRNDSEELIIIKTTDDGSTYSDEITVDSREDIKFSFAAIKGMQIISSGATSAYQVIIASKYHSDITSDGGTANSVIRGRNFDTEDLEYIYSVDNRLLTSNQDFFIEVARGNFSELGISSFSQNGFNSDVDNAWETVAPWDNTRYVWPDDSGIQMEVVSSSASDDGDPAGTGVQTVRIHYLDDSNVEQEETVTLNGTTPVNTVATNIRRVNDFHTVTVGTNGYAVGNIDLRNTAGTIIYSRIETDENNQAQCVYTVPAGKTLYINEWQIATGYSSTGRFTRFQLLATQMDGIVTPGIFYTLEDFSVLDGSLCISISIPYKIPETTDIVINAIGDASNSDAKCSALFEGWLE